MPIVFQLKNIFLLIAFVCSAILASGQVITTGTDSTIVTTTQTDTLSTGIFGALKTWDKPSRAALFSAIIPGAGQFYNKRYWKIPIIYIGGAAIGYFLLDYHKKYLLYRSSLAVLTDGDPATVDVFAAKYPDEKERARRLAKGIESTRRYRDYDIIYMCLLYGLNVGEAYVDAHLKDFDISDDLSLKFEPTLIPGPYLSYAPGFSIKLNLKK